MAGLFAARRQRRLSLVGLPIIAGFAAAVLVAVPSICRARLTDREQTQAELLRNLPGNAHVLYVLGDLNGDGVVDRSDLALLRELVAAKAHARPDRVRCFAAGDINLDQKVDRRDIDVLARWLDKAPQVDIPALYWQPALPCAFGAPYLAGSVDPAPGDRFVIRFLDPDYSPSNTRAEIHRGSATIHSAPDNKGFVGEVSSSAKPGDLIVVLLTLPKNRRYYYNLPVRSGSPIR